jgi:hypothetical protein
MNVVALYLIVDLAQINAEELLRDYKFVKAPHRAGVWLRSDSMPLEYAHTLAAKARRGEVMIGQYREAANSGMAEAVNA